MSTNCTICCKNSDYFYTFKFRKYILTIYFNEFHGLFISPILALVVCCDQQGHGARIGGRARMAENCQGSVANVDCSGKRLT
jgi:hypothetical protein